MRFLVGITSSDFARTTGALFIELPNVRQGTQLPLCPMPHQVNFAGGRGHSGLLGTKMSRDTDVVGPR